MTTPEYGGFVGFDGFRVSAAEHDFVALDSADGIDRFETHFRGEGRRQANQIARELITGILFAAEEPVLAGLVDAVRRFSVATPAQRAYTEGLSAHLRHNAAGLRGIAALREIGLSTSYITSYEADLTAASDLPNPVCEALAVVLEGLSAAIGASATTYSRAASDSHDSVTDVTHATPSAEDLSTTSQSRSSPQGIAGDRHHHGGTPRRGHRHR